MTLSVSPTSSATIYQELSGRRLRTPTDRRGPPNTEALISTGPGVDSNLRDRSRDD